MQSSKGIAAGFAAGLVVASGAILLLREDAPAALDSGSARILALDAQIQRLEQSVSTLTAVVSAGLLRPANADSTGIAVLPAQPAAEAEEAEGKAAQIRALAAADAVVDQALQSGQWTIVQQHEFNMMASELSTEEHGRLLARISKAINEDRLQVELP